jgi:hydroxymethylpyrimidine pyrophosphatase-like HAD family hydrolase
VRVGALFTDYDGTIAPSNVSRDDSQVPHPVAEKLKALSSLIPVAIITSKDYAFVRPRTEFASAWACCAGIEITLADGSTQTSVNARDLGTVLTEVRKFMPKDIFLEEKRSRNNTLIGFCIDWTSTTISGELRSQLSTFLARKAVYVESQFSFLDAFAAPPDKGSALTKLKRLLQADGATLYLGDSTLDNAAFQESDIGIGIDHGQPMEDLSCEYRIRYEAVEGLLESLLQNRLELTVGTIRLLRGVK